MAYFGSTTDSDGTSRTGPSRPDVNSASPFFQRRHVVNVCRPVGLGLPCSSQSGQARSVPSGFLWLSSGNCSSPIIRLGQRLVTLTSSAFWPAVKAWVTSRP